MKLKKLTGYKHLPFTKKQKERRLREYYRQQPEWDNGDQGFAGKDIRLTTTQSGQK